VSGWLEYSPKVLQLSPLLMWSIGANVGGSTTASTQVKGCPGCPTAGFTSNSSRATARDCLGLGFTCYTPIDLSEAGGGVPRRPRSIHTPSTDFSVEIAVRIMDGMMYLSSGFTAEPEFHHELSRVLQVAPATPRRTYSDGNDNAEYCQWE
jgi:hypothetical protein